MDNNNKGKSSRAVWLGEWYLRVGKGGDPVSWRNRRTGEVVKDMGGKPSKIFIGLELTNANTYGYSPLRKDKAISEKKYYKEIKGREIKGSIRRKIKRKGVS